MENAQGFVLLVIIFILMICFIKIGSKIAAKKKSEKDSRKTVGTEAGTGSMKSEAGMGSAKTSEKKTGTTAKCGNSKDVKEIYSSGGYEKYRCPYCDGENNMQHGVCIVCGEKI